MSGEGISGEGQGFLSPHNTRDYVGYSVERSLGHVSGLVLFGEAPSAAEEYPDEVYGTNVNGGAETSYYDVG